PRTSTCTPSSAVRGSSASARRSRAARYSGASSKRCSSPWPLLCMCLSFRVGELPAIDDVEVSEQGQKRPCVGGVAGLPGHLHPIDLLAYGTGDQEQRSEVATVGVQDQQFVDHEVGRRYHRCRCGSHPELL